MAKSWSIPKTLARTFDLNANEKLIISLLLQYTNAGCDNADPSTTKACLGMRTSTFNATVRRLNEKNLLKTEESGALSLNHTEAILKKYLSLNNYKDPSLVLK